MQTASPAFAAALASPDQLVAWRVQAFLPATTRAGVAIPASYWDLTQCVVDADIEGSTTTTTPEQTTLIDGVTAAIGTITLSGMLAQAAGVAPVEAQSVYWLFNPHDPTSPLYGLPKAGMKIVVQEGRWVGGTTPEFVTVGTFFIDTCDCSNGTVTLTLIDGRNRIRGSANLPPVITPAPYNAGLTSEFAVDYLLRHSTPGQYRSWPKQRGQCVLAVGMRSSVWPEVGTFNPNLITAMLPAFIQGQWGTALNGCGPAAGILYSPSTPIAPASSTFWIEWFGNAGNGVQFVTLQDVAGGFIDIEIELTFSVAGLVLTVNTTGGGGANTVWSFTPSAGVHYVAAQINWTAGTTLVTGTLYYESALHAFSFSAASARSTTAVMNYIAVGINGTTGSMEGVQVTTESAFGLSNFGFIPTLILDPSLNPLTALPDTNGQDEWTVLQQIAAAESAVLLIDEVDVAHFINRGTIAAKASTATLSSRVNLTALDSSEQLSTVATHVQVPVNQLFISAPTTVWGVSSAIMVPPGGTSFIASTDTPVVNVPATDSGFFPSFGAGAVNGQTYWRACVTADGTGIPATLGIRITVDQLSSQALAVAVSNDNAFPIWLVNPSSYSTGGDGTLAQPSLIIGGQKITNSPVALDGSTSPSSVVADAQWPPTGTPGAGTPYGEIVLAIPANPWIQDLPSAQAFALHLLSDSIKPRPLIRNATIVSDPRVQMVDRVTLLDPDVSQINTDALIVGSHIRYTAGEWSRALDLRLWWSPGAWRLGIPGYSELGVTTYL